MIFGADGHLCLHKKISAFDFGRLKVLEGVCGLGPAQATLHSTQLDVGALRSVVFPKGSLESVKLMNHFIRVVEPTTGLPDSYSLELTRCSRLAQSR